MHCTCTPPPSCSPRSDARTQHRLQERNQRYNLILNKVDQLRDDRKTLLLPLAEEIRRCAGADTDGQPMVKKVFATSASAGKGICCAALDPLLGVNVVNVSDLLRVLGRIGRKCQY